MTTGIKALRKALGNTPKFEDGTVVRWTSTNDHRAIEYRYVAVFAAAHWHLSGGAAFYGASIFTTEAFLSEVLAAADEGSVEMAIEWEVV